jgi:SAM-dependent methyltransferase
MSTDEAWEKWGKQDPYYGVLSSAKFRRENLTDDSLDEFFASGTKHVEHMLENIRKARPEFHPRRVMDYGCGVGRIVRSLCHIADHVVGVDVSESMLIEAGKNCPGATLIHARQLDHLLPEFDLIHSHFVFQHIPVRRGEAIFQQLIGLLAPDGIGVIHLTFLSQRLGRLPLPMWDAMQRLRGRSKLVHGLMNLTGGRSFSEPQMQMNNYSINRIFGMLRDAECSIFRVEFPENGQDRRAIPSIALYFEKQKEERH